MIALSSTAISPSPAQAVDYLGPFTAKVDIDGRKTARVDDRTRTNAYVAGEEVDVEVPGLGRGRRGQPHLGLRHLGFLDPRRLRRDRDR